MKERPVKYIHPVIGIGIFMITAIVYLSVATLYVMPYNAKSDKIDKTLYSDDKDMDRVDVCFIGGSHGLNAFNPQMMWENAHIRSYNFCYAGETFPLTRYYLKELYKKRKFALVVVDTYYAGLDDRDFGQYNYCFDVVSRMRPDFLKFGYVRDHVDGKMRKLEYFFPIIRYHDRWEEVVPSDITGRDVTDDDYLLGGDYHYDRNAGESIVSNAWKVSAKSGIKAPLMDGMEDDIRGVIELAKANGSDILFTDIPRVYDAIAPAKKWTDDECAVVNTLRDIASEYGVEVLSYDEDGLKKMGFRAEDMMYNTGHMNIYGSHTYSKELSDYITKHYDVPTYDSDDIWDAYLRRYKKELADKGVKEFL